MQALDTKPHKAIVDLGNRGVDKANPDIDIKHRGKFKGLTGEEKKSLKRRQAIESIIGHLKADHRMSRCHLKESRGNSLHAVLCAAGYNIRWLLRMIMKKGISLFFSHAFVHRFGGNGPPIAAVFMGHSVKSRSINLTLV